MLGRKGPTVTEQVGLLERNIVTVRADQRAAQHQLEEAVSTEIRALALLDASRAIQTRCRRKVTEYAEAICSLQDEIAALIPKQREGS